MYQGSDSVIGKRCLQLVALGMRDDEQMPSGLGKAWDFGKAQPGDVCKAFEVVPSNSFSAFIPIFEVAQFYA